MSFFLYVLMICFCCSCSMKADYKESAQHYDSSYDDFQAYPQNEILYEQERGFEEKKGVSSNSSYYKTKQSLQKNIPQQNQQPNISDLIHYNGYAYLQVDRVDETLTQIVTLAKEMKGTIERQSSKSITIRVPKASFHTAFVTLLDLGEVLQKSITSEDVSEAYTSVELRLKTSKTTRDRLIALLEKTTDDKEKINLLREIQRLNEQIDRMDAQMRTLKNLADFSSISVELISKRAEQYSSGREFESAGFSWIHDLSPFKNTVCKSGERLEVEIMEGLVVLNKKGAFVAESADGVVLRSTRLENNPQGSSSFWKQAIQGRLENGFGKTEEIEDTGDFLGIELWEDSNNPYIWLIYVRSNGDDLDLIEVFFPDENKKTRYIEKIQDGIGGVQ
jgi:hypothetical protein